MFSASLSVHARPAALGGIPAGVPTDDRHDDAGDDHFVLPLSRSLPSFCLYYSPRRIFVI